MACTSFLTVALADYLPVLYAYLCLCHLHLTSFETREPWSPRAQVTESTAT
jgi:hypothetical protein